MEPNVVTKVVTDELSITARVMNGMKDFAMTRGIDFLEAIIIFIVGYILCRYIRRAVDHILTKSNIDPSAKTFIEEIIFFFCLAIVAIVALGTAGIGNRFGAQGQYRKCSVRHFHSHFPSLSSRRLYPSRC